METPDNKEIVRRFVEDVENTGNVAIIDRYIADDYTEVYDGEFFRIGIPGAVEHVLGVRRAFPDLEVLIEHQMAEDDLVATIYSVTGTFRGDWLGMKPTGKKITFTGVNVDKVRNGKIVQHGGAANLFDPLLRAGLIEKK